MRKHLGLILIGYVVSGENACLDQTVALASSSGFLVSIYNCLLNTGNDDGGPQLCLGRFIADNADGNSYPITGACRDAYSALVNAWSQTVGDCQEGEFVDFPSAGCIADSLMVGMKTFYSTAGYFPMYPQCTFEAVRHYAMANTYTNLVTASMSTDVSWSPLPETSICDFCYTEIFGPLVYDQAASDPEWAEICLADPNSAECIDSAAMVDVLNVFERCAGKSIKFDGPMCTPTQVANVETFIPRPYFEFVSCAYNVDAWACSQVQDYLSSIDQATGSSDCDLCYTELQAAIVTTVTDASIQYCVPDVLAPDCLSYLQTPLMNFETCSGTTVATTPTSAPTSAPNKSTVHYTTQIQTNTTTGKFSKQAISALSMLSTIAIALLV